jgi:hypothetical protein
VDLNKLPIMNLSNLGRSRSEKHKDQIWEVIESQPTGWYCFGPSVIADAAAPEEQ